LLSDKTGEILLTQINHFDDLAQVSAHFSFHEQNLAAEADAHAKAVYEILLSIRLVILSLLSYL
jgi:hypothetical protein